LFLFLLFFILSVRCNNPFLNLPFFSTRVCSGGGGECSIEIVFDTTGGGEGVFVFFTFSKGEGGGGGGGEGEGEG
jgi:hypothetical protein